MNRKKLWQLFSVSLRYASPQVTEKARKKGYSSKKMNRYLISQFLWVAVLFLVLYGGMMLTVNFSQMPGFFTMYLGLFAILAITQGISVIYNIFFESRDLPAYLPLPFSQGEIFIAKILVVMLNVVPYCLPLLALFIITGIQSRVFLPLAIVLGFVAFLFLTGSLLFIGALIVLGLTRTKVFQQHKKAAITALMMISTVGAVAGVMLLQGSGAATLVADRTALPFFLPIYWVLKQPATVLGLVGWLLVIGVFAFLAFVIQKGFLPKLYEQLTEISSSNQVTRRRRKLNRNFSQQLRSYNLQLLKEPNLLMQVLSSSVLMPVIILISMGFNLMGEVSNLPDKFVGVAFVLGIFLSYLMTNQNSFVANLISLDGPNYEFILSLPIEKKAYLKQKFLIGWGIQTLLVTIMILVAGIIIVSQPLLIFGSLLGGIFGSLIFSLFFFARDYRLLMTNWTNITQLFSRGGGSIVLAMGIFGGMLVGGILITVYAMAVNAFDFAPLNLFVLGGVLLIGCGIILYFKTQFWNKLDTLSWRRRIALGKKAVKD
ncbi:ABC transporter [Enterococcus sp. 2201sp1_2201st1_B8_2201SCRN_220225]|uniref:ABC transporter n=1 Tax=unclassified Enterococcus TaxID=2608891 RepID=UPI0034A27599